MIENFKNVENFDFEPTKFVGYETLNTLATVIGLFDENNQPVTSLTGHGYICFDQTPFYAVSGGQASDHGTINYQKNLFELIDVRKDLVYGYYIHEVNTLNQTIHLNDQLELNVDQQWRVDSSINHSSLHIMWQTILRHVGHYVGEVGSKLDQQKYQLQFMVDDLITPELVMDVTNEFNNRIIPLDIKTNIFYLTQQEAKDKNYLYEFTKIAGDELVRMVEFPGIVIEPCSGTHMSSTKEAKKTWFLNYDKNSKRILIEMTSNANYANEYFQEKLINRVEEIHNLILKGKNQQIVDDHLNDLYEQAQKLSLEWNYLSIKAMNQIHDEVAMIINKALKEIERNLIEEIKTTNFDLQPVNNFLIIQTNNDFYTNKLFLPKASAYANQENQKVIAFLNKHNDGANLILIHNRDYDFNLKQLLPTIMEQTSFKGGGSESMIQLTSPNQDDLEKVLLLLNQE